MLNKDYSSAIKELGYCVQKGLLTEDQVTSLIDVVAPLQVGMKAYGVRDLLAKIPAVKELAHSSALRHCVESVLGPECFPVRAILFDKLPEANWSVPWHQDLTIAVKEKTEADGFHGWSIKEGVVHVNPPMEFLERMLTLRIHLDRADTDNGALGVIPGSHLWGRIPAEKLGELSRQHPSVWEPVNAGDVFIMRPLILHSSKSSVRPSHRRIIHIEYSSMPLPFPLQWKEN